MARAAPIVLTDFGDTLYSSTAQEEDALLSRVGQHEVCGGMIELKPTAPNFRALVCHQCLLRVVIPNDVKTYAGLQNWADNERELLKTAPAGTA